MVHLGRKHCSNCQAKQPPGYAYAADDPRKTVCLNCSHKLKPDDPTTRKLLVKLHSDHPRLTIAECAGFLGVTRQRIYQIARSESLVFLDGRKTSPRMKALMTIKKKKEQLARSHSAALATFPYQRPTTVPVNGKPRTRCNRCRAKLPPNHADPRRSRAYQMLCPNCFDNFISDRGPVIETTYERLIELHNKQPALTMAQCARELGVSRQRIVQLAKPDNLQFPDSRGVPARRKYQYFPTIKKEK